MHWLLLVATVHSLVFTSSSRNLQFHQSAFLDIDNDLAGTDYTIGFDTATILRLKLSTESGILPYLTTVFLY
jgi:hypothetical protein